MAYRVPPLPNVPLNLNAYFRDCPTNFSSAACPLSFRTGMNRYARHVSFVPSLSPAAETCTGTAGASLENHYFASFDAMRSASMIVVTLVATDGISGMMDASTTCRLLTPRTLPHASTTAVGSESPPIGTVEVGWR